MKDRSHDIVMQNKVFVWIAIATGLILMVPLIAMQVTSEFDWDAIDFITIGSLLFGMGSMFVLVARRIRNNTYRVIVGILFTLFLLYIWAELAVGIFTTWGS